MFLEEIRCGLQRAIALLAKLLCAWVLLAIAVPDSGARHALERLLAPAPPHRPLSRQIPPPPVAPAVAIPPGLRDVQLSPGGQRFLGTIEDPSCEAEYDDWSSTSVVGDADGETH